MECDNETLGAMARTATELRKRWLDDARAAWKRGRRRRATELRTAAVYAFHVARWARTARTAKSRPTNETRARTTIDNEDGRHDAHA